MTRWTVVKYRFYTKDTKNLHTLEFIVSKNEHTMSERTVRKMADKILCAIGKETEERLMKEEHPVFDFGSLKINDFLDDVRKLALVEFPKAKDMKVQLWFDKDQDVSFWDDGFNKIPKNIK